MGNAACQLKYVVLNGDGNVQRPTQWRNGQQHGSKGQVDDEGRQWYENQAQQWTKQGQLMEVIERERHSA